LMGWCLEISQIQSQGLLCPLFLASAAVSASVTSIEADAVHVQSVRLSNLFLHDAVRFAI